MHYTLPFGDDELKFSLPAPWPPADVVEGRQEVEPLEAGEIERRLTDFARHIVSHHDPDRSIWAIFTDVTRASPDQTLLEPVIRILEQTDVPIKLMCAVGMHRPSTRAEKQAKLGSWLSNSFEVIDHDPATVVELTTVDGVPVEINPLLLDATLISVGVVEPHQYAGYSGGTKTVVIGCGGPTTIARTHGPEFLNRPGTRLGNIEGNPFQRFLRAAGQHVEHEYAINVVMNASQEIVHLDMGSPDHVHDTLVSQARQLYEIPVHRAPYDVVVAGVGAPKDANLYQASRAATYIALSAQPAIRQGGVIILPAPLPEDGGQGTGERNTMDALRRFGPTPALIDHMLQHGCRPGEQRAFIIAQMMQAYRLIVVGAQHPDFLPPLGIAQARDMPAALGMAEAILGTKTPRMLVVPHALKFMPVPAGNR